MSRNLDVLLIGFVERDDEPKDTGEDEEEYEDKKLLVHIAEQEILDGANYPIEIHRFLPLNGQLSAVNYFCNGVLAVSL